MTLPSRSALFQVLAWLRPAMPWAPGRGYAHRVEWVWWGIHRVASRGGWSVLLDLWTAFHPGSLQFRPTDVQYCSDEFCHRKCNTWFNYVHPSGFVCEITRHLCSETLLLGAQCCCCGSKGIQLNYYFCQGPYHRNSSIEILLWRNWIFPCFRDYGKKNYIK